MRVFADGNSPAADWNTRPQMSAWRRTKRVSVREKETRGTHGDWVLLDNSLRTGERMQTGRLSTIYFYFVVLRGMRPDLLRRSGSWANLRTTLAQTGTDWPSLLPTRASLALFAVRRSSSALQTVARVVLVKRDPLTLRMCSSELVLALFSQ